MIPENERCGAETSGNHSARSRSDGVTGVEDSMPGFTEDGKDRDEFEGLEH